MEESRKNKTAKFFGELLKMVRLVGLFFGLYFGLYMIAVVLGLANEYRTYVIFAAAAIAGIACFFLLPKDLRQMKIPAKPGKVFPENLLLIAGIVCLGIFLTVWLNRLMFLIPWTAVLSEEQVASAEGNFEIPFPVSVIGYGLLAPFAEEVCFRGILYGFFSKWMKAPIAIAISALLFGLYHVNPVQGVYAVLMGAVMAFLVWMSGSLGASMLFHMTSNLLVVFYSSSTALYDFILSPAGTVLTIALGVAGVILLVFAGRRKKDISAEGDRPEGSSKAVEKVGEGEK